MSANARRVSRSLAVQALYQWSMNHSSVSELIAQFSTQPKYKSCDKLYFNSLLEGALGAQSRLDPQLQVCVSRDLKEVDPIELAILRVATYELSECLDVPYRVVINEGVEISKQFGTDTTAGFVNGVLDKLAKSLRTPESRAAKI